LLFDGQIGLDVAMRGLDALVAQPQGNDCDGILLEGDSDKAMDVQSNENAALLKLLKTKSRTKTELLKVSSERRRARQEALDALLAEGKVRRRDIADAKRFFSRATKQHCAPRVITLDGYAASHPGCR
jgi:hypothetical protein